MCRSPHPPPTWCGSRCGQFSPPLRTLFVMLMTSWREYGDCGTMALRPAGLHWFVIVAPVLDQLEAFVGGEWRQLVDETCGRSFALHSSAMRASYSAVGPLTLRGVLLAWPYRSATTPSSVLVAAAQNQQELQHPVRGFLGAFVRWTKTMAVGVFVTGANSREQHPLLSRAERRDCRASVSNLLRSAHSDRREKQTKERKIVASRARWRTTSCSMWCFVTSTRLQALARIRRRARRWQDALPSTLRPWILSRLPSTSVDVWTPSRTIESFQPPVLQSTRSTR